MDLSIRREQFLVFQELSDKGLKILFYFLLFVQVNFDKEKEFTGIKIFFYFVCRDKDFNIVLSLVWVFVFLEKYGKFGESLDKSNENDERVGT